MNALHEQFVAEARELIHQANDDLIAAEREGFSDDRINRVFRAFHTLKGSAGVVNLPAMGLVMHAAEDVLAEIQAGRLGATSAVIDQALGCPGRALELCADYHPVGAGDFERCGGCGGRDGVPGGEAARRAGGSLNAGQGAEVLGVVGERRG